MSEPTSATAIRVWLEPGYDHGRTGAWLLDWPGAFAWGPTRAGALARVQSAASRHLAWLASHGEAATAPETDRVERVEEVATDALRDGYQRMATFSADGARARAHRARINACRNVLRDRSELG